MNPSSISTASTLASRTLIPTTRPSNDSQLRHAATDFESILLGQWLQGAEDTFAEVPGTDENEDAGEQQLKAYAVQSLARAFTHAGGIGISTMVAKALEHRIIAEEPRASAADTTE